MSAAEGNPFLSGLAAAQAAAERSVRYSLDNGEGLDMDDVAVVMHEYTRRGHEIEWLHTWHGLMWLLDEQYPADIFTGESGDEGPRTIALVRELDKARELRAASEQGLTEAIKGLFTAQAGLGDSVAGTAVKGSLSRAKAARARLREES